MSHAWGDRTYREIASRSRDRLVAILPLGAVEAHGPHLPLVTDGIIALAMAEACARRLDERGLQALVLPPLEYSAAPFAREFSGTVSVRAETVTAMVRDIGWALSPRVACLALANAHLDPAHLGSLHAAVDELASRGVPVAFPDLTRKPWALRLGEEFLSGACHAGSFETSVVMAARPELVHDDIRGTLPANPRSLSRAIQEGKRTFGEAGGPDAYFGAPGDASSDEGLGTIAELGAILEDAIFQALSEGSAS